MVRPLELTSSIKEKYIMREDLAEFLPMGTARSANGSIHEEVTVSLFYDHNSFRAE